MLLQIFDQFGSAAVVTVVHATNFGYTNQTIYFQTYFEKEQVN